MTALLKDQGKQELHYWMLWVAPNKEQTLHIKKLPASQRQRVLMLHPKDIDQLVGALEIAILSDLYQAITLPCNILPGSQQDKLKILAIRHNTILSWVNTAKPLNSASQLRLI